MSTLNFILRQTKCGLSFRMGRYWAGGHEKYWIKTFCQSTPLYFSFCNKEQSLSCSEAVIYMKSSGAEAKHQQQ